MQKEDLPSQNWIKKTRGRLFGFLAFRVLLVSFVFIVVPLIFYSLVIYGRDYSQKLRDVFEELRLYQEDQINYVNQMEMNYLNFIDSFYKMGRLAQSLSQGADDKHIAMILTEFAQKAHITGIFYLKLLTDGRLICTDTTQPLYEDVDFSRFIDVQQFHKSYDTIFIAKDPIFQQSLYVTYAIRNGTGGPIVALIVATIALDQLVDQIANLRSIYETNISIMDKNYEVLASSEPTFVGQTFKVTKGDKKDEKKLISEGMVPLEEMSILKNAFKFSLLESNRFAVISRFPHTDNYLFLSIPAKIVLFELYHYIWHLASLLIFIIIVGGLATYLLTLRMSKPLQQLGFVMTRVGEGDLHQAFHKDPMGFEINYLGEQFNQMVASLVTHMEEAEKERASKEAYAKEIQIGHTIQSSILPATQSVFPGMKVSVYFKPAKEVAGDFYDWILQGPMTTITIADGVGKGISSCLYSFDLRSMIKSFASIETDLSRIIIDTNRLFCADTKESGNFVTAFIARYHSEKKHLEFANCGHNHPFVKREDGQILRLEAKGIAFGVEPFEQIDLQTMQLQKNDLIILYTDGISEAQDTRFKLFGEARLMDAIKSPHAHDPDSTIRTILTSVDAFTEGVDQYDDMTMIVCQVTD